MPPDSSHLLQPLDVACFSPLKRAYGKLVENKMRLGFNHIDKFDFLEAYPYAHADIFKPETIRDGFAATGLIPFDPERVLSQLNTQIMTPTPPGSRSTNSAPKTPDSLGQVEKQATRIKMLLRHHTESSLSPTNAALNQLVKGCEMVLNSAIILAKENQDLQAAHAKQLQKRERSKQQMAAAGGLSIQEDQQLLQHENEVQDDQDAQPTEPAPAAIKQRIRAPPRCSDCHVIGHKRLQCPSRCRD